MNLESLLSLLPQPSPVWLGLAIAHAVVLPAWLLAETWVLWRRRRRPSVAAGGASTAPDPEAPEMAGAAAVRETPDLLAELIERVEREESERLQAAS